MLPAKNVRRRCLLAPWAGGNRLFLILVLLPCEMMSYYSREQGHACDGARTAVQLQSAVFQLPVGSLLTGAAFTTEAMDLRMTRMDGIVEGVCTVNGVDYRDDILTSVDVSALPSTPEAGIPLMHNGIARAIQGQRRRLVHQIRHIGYSVIVNATGAGSGARTKSRRSASRTARSSVRRGNTGRGSRDDGFGWDFSKDDSSLTHPESFPDGTTPLEMDDVISYYSSLIAGYLALMLLGVVAVVLALVLLPLLISPPRCLKKSTGGFVNLFCFSGASSTAQQAAARDILYGSSNSAAPGDRDVPAVGGTVVKSGNDMFICEARSSAGSESTEGKAYAKQSDGEAYGAGYFVTGSDKGGRCTVGAQNPWTGQTLGLIFSIIFLFSVLLCVALTFAYAAQLSQALHAMQCAMSATFVTPFIGTGDTPSTGFITKLRSLNFGAPEGPKDEDDYLDRPSAYRVMQQLFQFCDKDEDEVAELLLRFNGAGLEAGLKDRHGIHFVRRLAASDLSITLPGRHIRRLGEALEDTGAPDDGKLPRFMGMAIQRDEGLASRGRRSRGQETGARLTASGRGKIFSGTATSHWDLGEDRSVTVGKHTPGDGGQTIFVGILPVAKMFALVADALQKDSPKRSSAVAAMIFSKGVSSHHLLISLYDHCSALQEILQAGLLHRSESPFDHYSLAYLSAAPALAVLLDAIEFAYTKMIEGTRELHENIQEIVETEDSYAEMVELENAGAFMEPLDSITEYFQEMMESLTYFRNVTLLLILYLSGAILAFLLVGSVMYLIYLNRQPVKVWESGGISPSPSAGLGWLLLVVGGAALTFGAVLLTVSVGLMDLCIFTSTTLQDPELLSNTFSGDGSDPQMNFWSDLTRSCLAHGADKRVLNPAAEMGLSTDKLPSDIKRLTEAMQNGMDKVKEGISELEEIKWLKRLLSVVVTVMDLAYQHADIYLLRHDMIADPKTPTATYYSGLQDETIEFRSMFNLMRAELLNKLEVDRENLWQVPPQLNILEHLVNGLQTSNPGEVAENLKAAFDKSKPMEDRLDALIRLYTPDAPQGHYRLYGLNQVQQDIAPLYLGAVISDEEAIARGWDRLLKVDDSSQAARTHTNRLLAGMPQPQRDAIGAAIELGRRKTAARPGKRFMCIRRTSYSSHNRRRADKNFIMKLARTLQTESHQYAYYGFPRWNDIIEEMAFGATGSYARQRYPCTYEEHVAQIKSEAEQALFATASFRARMEEMVNALSDELLVRGKAVSDSVTLLGHSWDCTPMYRNIAAVEQVLCGDTTERIVLLGITWIFASMLSTALFVVFFCIWRYLKTQHIRQTEEEGEQLEALRQAAKAAEDARIAEAERAAREQAAAAAAAKNAARTVARARQVSLAALNRKKTEATRLSSTYGSRLNLNGQSFGPGGGVRESLATRDEGDEVEDHMWADSTME